MANADRADWHAALCAIVGHTHVLDSDDEAARSYLKEWRGTFSPVARCIVRPESTEQVAAVVRLAAAHDLSIVPQSGNTGTVGGTAADDANGQILLNVDRMEVIREIDPDNATMTVEAGCTLGKAQRAAADAGFYLPIALASREMCCLGGNLGSNAGGLNVIRYGNTRDQVLGLEVVTADGRVWDNLSGLRKDNSGYDLNDLFVGSEGTLGVITACVLGLASPPRQRAVAFCAVSDVEAAVRFQRRIRQDTGDQVTGCELMSAQALSLALAYAPDAECPIEASQAWYLLIEVASAARGRWLSGIFAEALTAGRDAGEITAYAIADDEPGMDALWHLRESIPPAQSAEGASIKHDISLPVSRLPAFLQVALPDVAAVVPGIRPCVFGHVGDGNLHFNLTRPQDITDADFREYEAHLHRVVHDHVVAMRGSVAAEHGVGRLKVDEIQRVKSAVEIDMLRAIKRALDPHGRMNPGAVVRLT
ncbi:FAD-binding oxidoreductase [Salinisphaera sp. Q1T1-3]|uniref:FAD-binding oxidoreductase n=1 Tax=Salinisphaera sp. Q1T1-3 TaxID=2321229 RepID=UPI000E71CC2F|nr:FAD-binding oxidoreductase [Salinisphaera sp. Q1T1-3]RJS91315.1 FAD-binding oxidoreductase [Salinisphaera sp. Q1T1-3]